MLNNGIPETMVDEDTAWERAEAGEGHFLPVSIKLSTVEVELSYGAQLPSPIGVGQVVIVDVIRADGALTSSMEGTELL